MKAILHWLAAYGFAVAASVGLTCFVLQLQNADLRVPFCYHGDGLMHITWTKGIITNGWYLTNPDLGMPYGMEMHDFPMADNLHFLGLKILGLCGDATLATNLYYLATYPLTTFFALLVLRRLGIGYWPALMASLLFTFIPFHVMRGEGHLFLASYYLMPLMLLPIVEVARPRNGATPSVWRRFLEPVIIGAAMASAGVYYAFFGAFLMLVTGLTVSFGQRSLRPALKAVAFAAVILVATVANYYPNLRYLKQHGPNVAAVVRAPWQSEMFGLKIAQLLLPASGHRLEFLARFKDDYNYYEGHASPLYNENDSNTLGIIGAIGFLFLLGKLVTRRRQTGAYLESRLQPVVVDRLAALNGWALALGTVGGIGALLGIFMPQIRCYNRICVYIAFFSFAAVAYLLHRLWERWSPRPWLRFVTPVIIAVIFAVGLLDETTNDGSWARFYATSKQEFAQHAAFVHQIEAMLPEKAMVFQYPYVPYVEHAPPGRMMGYDHFRAYLHSKKLRWSYGAMVGRPGAMWQQCAVEKPIKQMLPLLCSAGFAGLWVDRDGTFCADPALETEIASILQTAPVVSEDGRYAFYNLVDYAYHLQQGGAPDAWQNVREAALHPVVFSWSGDFGGQEGSSSNHWRWCSDNGEIQCLNMTDQPRKIHLRMDCHTVYEEPATLEITGDLLNKRMTINAWSGRVAETITVPPGKHSIRFRCEGRPVWAPADPRKLVFRVHNFTAIDAALLQPEADAAH
jgi:phosphoglycerol transferase